MSWVQALLGGKLIVREILPRSITVPLGIAACFHTNGLRQEEDVVWIKGWFEDCTC